MFVLLILSLWWLMQNPIGCPTGFSRNLCSLRYKKEAKDGSKHFDNKSDLVYYFFSSILHQPSHAVRAHVYTCSLKRYQWYSSIHS